jgi:predicted nucleic-acid-binding Zn-ribbon protein
MSNVQPTPCPKCGSTDQDTGELTHVAFVSGQSFRHPFGHPTPVLAIACLKCGHIELVLDSSPGTEEQS